MFRSEKIRRSQLCSSQRRSIVVFAAVVPEKIHRSQLLFQSEKIHRSQLCSSQRRSIQLCASQRRSVVVCAAVIQSENPILHSIFCGRFIESVRMVAYVFCVSVWEVSFCTACKTASAYMDRQQVVALSVVLSSPPTLLECETRPVPCHRGGLAVNRPPQDRQTQGSNTTSSGRVIPVT